MANQESVGERKRKTSWAVAKKATGKSRSTDSEISLTFPPVWVVILVFFLVRVAGVTMERGCELRLFSDADTFSAVFLVSGQRTWGREEKFVASIHQRTSECWDLSQINGSFAFVEARGFAAPLFIFPWRISKKCSLLMATSALLGSKKWWSISCFDLQLPTLTERAEHRPL